MTEPTTSPPGRPEPPVQTLVLRWLAIGCLVTLAVLAMAFVGLGWVVVAGVFDR